MYFTSITCILIIIKVFSPTDAQLDSLKSNFKFALKFISKGPLHISVWKTPSSGSILLTWVLIKLQLLKWVKIHWCGSFGGVAAYIIIIINIIIIIVIIICILTHFKNCNFSKAQIVCSLKMVFFTQKHVGAF